MTPPTESRCSGIQNPEARSQDCVVEVSAGLIFRAGKMLITQRQAGSHLGGLWEFPGGKREAGESFAQCLIRELREELGVEIRVGELYEEVTHAYPEKTVHLQFLFCELMAREPQPLGCAALKWVERSELTKHRFPAADARLIGRLVADRGLWQLRRQSVPRWDRATPE
jgi:mutator protein MutT